MPMRMSLAAWRPPVTRSSKLTALSLTSMLFREKRAGSSDFGFACSRSTMSLKLKRCGSSRTMLTVRPSTTTASSTGASRSRLAIDALIDASRSVRSGALSPGCPSTVRPFSVTRSVYGFALTSSTRTVRPSSRDATVSRPQRAAGGNRERADDAEDDNEGGDDGADASPPRAEP